MNATDPLNLSSSMSLADQIKAQAGLDILELHTSQGVVEITREQATKLLAGRQLVIDPLTRKAEVR